jgi:phosphatidylglycerol:prolipoprotein diacylglycerol transferase
MRPVLFDIPFLGFGLHTYGVLLAAAFLAALWVALRGARRAGFSRDPILDIWIAALISGIVGAKLLLYLLDLDYYLSNPGALLWGLRSAGVFYGGLVAALGTCVFMVHRKGLPGWKLADIAAPAIALGQSIGRVGCFAAGCCYGKVSSLPWAVTFTDPEASRITGVPLEIPLHPAQLYMSAGNLLLFGALLLLSRRKSYDGKVFLWYLLLYGVMRGSLEFLRGDPRGELAGFSTSQWIAVAAIVTALVLMWTRRGRRASAPAA